MPPCRMPPALTCCFLLLALSGCDWQERLSFWPRSPSRQLSTAYLAYRQALAGGQVAQLRPLMAAAKAKELDNPAAAAALPLAAALLPAEVTPVSASITGDKGTLTLRSGRQVELRGGKEAPAFAPLSEVADRIATGTVTFVREAGRWKLEHEAWNVNGWPVPPPSGTPFASSPGAPRRLLQIAGRGRQVSGLAYTPDGQQLLSASYDDMSLSIWSAASGQEVATVKLDARPQSLVLAPDGMTAISVDVHGTLSFWPLGSGGFGTPTQPAERVGSNCRLAVSPDGRLLASASFDRLVTVWDLQQRTLLRRIVTKEPQRSIAFSPSGQLLAAGSTGNSLTLWDLEKGSGRSYTIAKVAATSDVSDLAFNADGSRLATVHMDSSITVWDVERQKELHNFYVSNAAAWSVRFSPEGSHFVTGHQDNNVHLWETASGRGIANLTGHRGAPQRLAFSPDGSTLASAAEDGEIILWRQ